jgi:hypothetical protein
MGIWNLFILREKRQEHADGGVLVDKRTVFLAGGTFPPTISEILVTRIWMVVVGMQFRQLPALQAV